MAFEDSPSNEPVPDNPLLFPPWAMPEREPLWVLLLGILMFAGLLYLTWERGASRIPPVSSDKIMSARLDTYQVEYWLYQQVHGGKLATLIDGKETSDAIKAGDAWRDISDAVMHADAQAARKNQNTSFYGAAYAASTSVNAAALYGAAGNLPGARAALAQAIARDPAGAAVYRQLLALYQPAAKPIALSPATEQLLRRLSTAPLLRARNAQLTGNTSGVLAALRPGERAGRRGIITSLIIGAFMVLVAVLFVLSLIYLISNWLNISLVLHRSLLAVSEAPCWGIGAALIAVSMVFLSTWVLLGLLVHFGHIKANNDQLIVPLSGAVEILCAVVVLGLFLAVHNQHPFDWSIFGWHAAKKQIGYGLATLLFVYPFVWLCILLSSHIWKDNSENPLITSLERTSNIWLIVSLIIVAVIVAPLVEETLFRGILFRALGARMPFWGAALLSGFLFALGHGERVVIIPFTLLGVAFAFLARKTENLWPSAAAHGVFNALSSVATLLFAWSMHGPGS